MDKQVTSISVFGLDGVLLPAVLEQSIKVTPPNPTTYGMFYASVRDPHSITAVVCGQPQTNHQPVQSWLQKHFSITSSPKPTSLMMRVGNLTVAQSAGQNLMTLLTLWPQVNRVEAVDSNPQVLSQYRDIIKSRNILFWRLLQVDDGSVFVYDASYCSRS